MPEHFPAYQPRLPDADIRYVRAFIPPKKADLLFQTLHATIPWRQDEITLFGKTHPLPRLQAWYGDPGAAYRYSGILLEPLPWTSELAALRETVEAAAGASFNSVLLNLYRDGRDSNGWHSDDEPSLGPRPVIASVSLGAARRFQLRHKREKAQRETLALAHGSLLVMAGPTQAYWQHQVPKTAKPVGPRINLTFRLIR